MSQKKNGAADYQYFKIYDAEQCNIFIHNEYSLYLVVCEASTSYAKRNLYDKRQMQAQNIFYHSCSIRPIIHNFRYV